MKSSLLNNESGLEGDYYVVVGKYVSTVHLVRFNSLFTIETMSRTVVAGRHEVRGGQGKRVD